MLSLPQIGLILSVIGQAFGMAADLTWQSIQGRLNRRRHRLHRAKALPPSSPPPATSTPNDHPPTPAPDSAVKTVVIIGASFAGYHAARVLAARIPPEAGARVVVVEPHSHFHFTWVFPRLSVLKPGTPVTASSSKAAGGDTLEGRAFIPYGGYVRPAGDGLVEWVRDRVVEVTPNAMAPGSGGAVALASGRVVPYTYLVLCTGSLTPAPSRIVDEDTKAGAERVLRAFQGAVEKAARVVVVGGGAVGYEVATDVKSLYGEGKSVTLVHSRDEVMHRFGPELRRVARERAEELGVVLVTGERVVEREMNEEGDGGEGKTEEGEEVREVVEGQRVRSVTLTSGRKIECDLLISSMGTQPASGLLASVSPSSIAPNRKVLVKPSLQIADDAFPNVFAAGDVAATDSRNPNARSAMMQAAVVAENILLLLAGKAASKVYRPFWGEDVIVLTLGVGKEVIQFENGKTEVLIQHKSHDITLTAEQAWSRLGAKPFVDPAEADGKEVDIVARTDGQAAIV